MDQILGPHKLHKECCLELLDTVKDKISKERLMQVATDLMNVWLAEPGVAQAEARRT